MNPSFLSMPAVFPSILEAGEAAGAGAGAGVWDEAEVQPASRAAETNRVFFTI